MEAAQCAKNDAQEKARYDVPDTLVRRGRGENGGRLYGREHHKDYADDHEDDRSPQKSYALVRKLEAHRAHDKGVRETRPSGEGDEASVRGRVTCGDQQETPSVT
jgi:hypothetical protein